MFSVDAVQDVTVLNGTYEPSDARQVLCDVIDKQINFYKLQHLSQWERNHECGTKDLDEKLNVLTKKRQEVMEIVKQARAEGRQITLGGSIQIAFE